MAAAYKATANSSAITVSNTEALVTGTVTVANASPFAVGDTLRLKLTGTLDPTMAFSFAIRGGANGAVSDAALFSANNQLTSTVLLNDLNAWFTANPGFTWEQYHSFPGFSANAASYPVTPAKIDGEFYLVCTKNDGANVSLDVMVPTTVVNGLNLATLFGAGKLGSANISATIDNKFCVTMSMTGPLSYNFDPVNGTTGPGNSWKLNRAANSSASKITFSLLEVQ